MSLFDSLSSGAAKVSGAIAGPAVAAMASITQAIGRPPAPVWGGVTSEGARALYEALQMIPLSRGNLFHVSIKDPNPPRAPSSSGGDQSSLMGKLSSAVSEVAGALGSGFAATYLINLLAVDIEFGPSTIAGEKVRVGSSEFDSVTGSEHTELRLTLMDDATGSVKRWFDGKCAQIALGDGTFGAPADYLVDITVKHMDVMDVLPSWATYGHKWRMRPVSRTADLSRSEQRMELVTVSFTQYHTFG